jgi:hypothetical protein
MNQPNRLLKSLFILKDGSLTESCRKLEMDFQRLSRIINNRVRVKPEEKRKISWYLQKPIDELFKNDRC